MNIDKEIAKRYADHFHRIKTNEEVVNDIKQKILDASLNGEYHITYPINTSNAIIHKDPMKIKDIFVKQLGFELHFEKDSDFRSGSGEIVSITISWRT